MIGNYIIGKTLGEGSSGKVKLGTHKQTGEEVAIKILSKKKMKTNGSYAKKIAREIAILRLLDHPHVLKLYDVFETSKNLYLIMEHLNYGDLFGYLSKRSSLTNEEALSFFQQIIWGLDYCHNHFVCHRDLKPENLLLSDNYNVKIADFGLARMTCENNLLKTSCGSPHYISPEIAKGMLYEGRSSDVWSCGIILYVLLSGNLPFTDINIQRLLEKITIGKFTTPSFFTFEQKDLINKMLTVDPQKRITIPEIKKHPWFTSNLPKNYRQPESSISLKNIQLKIDVDHIDNKIFSHLQSLGFHNPVNLRYSLTNEEMNLQKVLYYLFKKKMRFRDEKLKSNNKSKEKVESELDLELNLNLNLNEKSNLDEKFNQNLNDLNDFNDLNDWWKLNPKPNQSAPPKIPEDDFQVLHENLIFTNTEDNLTKKENTDPIPDTEWIDITLGFQQEIPSDSKIHNFKKSSPIEIKTSKTTKAKKNQKNHKSKQIEKQTSKTPQFHRIGLYSLEENCTKSSRSPKKSWFGSWFSKSKEKQKNLTQKKTNIQLDPKPITKSTENQLTFTRFSPPESSSSSLHYKIQMPHFLLLSKLQSYLDSLHFNYSHPNEFIIRVNNKNIIFTIQIDQNSNCKNRSLVLEHIFHVRLKFGDVDYFNQIWKEIENEIKLKMKLK
ncbi:serine/threonine-protein kinase brsk2-like protein [Anaeramoeba ignava]|uniref:Serine/threonine-protein kinase brsk2-like protein n=1 Tax=Anaeramoeba ignava TaxID=1746090 RepID=A0A9Q0RFM5_ANAIG|nr:serine/threonine-protein kinase brsk2-like protein [Anaeramoeba ignava]